MSELGDEGEGEVGGEGESEVNTNEVINPESKEKATKVKKKKVSCKEKKWSCENEPLWRVFVNSYLDKEKKIEKEDIFGRREAAVLPRFPNVERSSEEIPLPASYPCFPLNTFNLTDSAKLPEKLVAEENIRLWTELKSNLDKSCCDKVLPKISKPDCREWPKTWPCVNEELIENEGKKKDPQVEKDLEDFAARRELGHARVPVTCPNIKKSLLVDRAVGQRPGFVNGQYIVFTFGSNDSERRVYTGVCLRGLKGMHLAELGAARIREKTWKFCFYQAIIALLAKTQLRYKFAWSSNIDYIFDHAWMLFVHMGSLNCKQKIRLNDVVVYNYKYSVELELVHEIKDAPEPIKVPQNYVEDDFIDALEFDRPELTKIPEEIGWEKPKYPKPPPVHSCTRKIEKWFDRLPETYRNCVFRTSKFCLAFWKDGNFWYLYNPYRCDEFGYWCNEGYACMLKFCTRLTLKRHLMILMLRAYSWEPNSPLKFDLSEDMQSSARTTPEKEGQEDQSEKSSTSEESNNEPKNDFKVQIYQLIYHDVQIHNMKLLKRKPPGPKLEKVKPKVIDDCDDLFNKSPLDLEDDPDESATSEKRNWLQNVSLTWARFSTPKKETRSKLRWHEYYVEEPQKLFTLWGETHPTDEIFVKDNRGKQIFACYVVAAGMTRLQAPEYWSPKTLDAIVMCGDRYYTISRQEKETIAENNERYLSNQFKIGETLFECNVGSALCGRLYDGKLKCLWRMIEKMFLQYHFGILTCESTCLGIFKFCDAYYIMDAHSYGPPLFQYGHGVAYVIRATSFYKFMNVLIVTISSIECSKFWLHPIEIKNVIDLGTTDMQTKKIKVLKKPECHHEAKNSKPTCHGC